MGLAAGADRPSGLGYRGSDYVFRQALRGRPGAESRPGAAGPPGNCSLAGCARLEVKSGFAFPELFGSALAGEDGVYPLPDFPALCLLTAHLCGVPAIQN